MVRRVWLASNNAPAHQMAAIQVQPPLGVPSLTARSLAARLPVERASCASFDHDRHTTTKVVAKIRGCNEWRFCCNERSLSRSSCRQYNCPSRLQRSSTRGAQPANKNKPAAKGWKEDWSRGSGDVPSGDICPIGAKSVNKQITFSVVLGLALLNVCASVEAKPPTCTQTGGQVEERAGIGIGDSELRRRDGHPIGPVQSPIRGTTGSHPMVGWINSARSETSDSKGNHAEVITFAVHLGPPSAA